MKRAMRNAGATAGIPTAAAAAVLLAALAGPAAAEVDLHGFVEGAWGVRVADDPAFDGVQDYTLSETRAQLRVSATDDAGEVFIRADVLQDHVASDGTDVILREGFLRFTTAKDHLDVKAGRQALTWGTGDLIFINDLFPKDWESFFAGREDQYLKAPADALRLGIFGLPFDVDLVLTPEFTPDRFPVPGERLSFGLPPDVAAPPAEPASTVTDGELALRLSRYVEAFTLSGYFYRGRFKTPEGLRLLPSGGGLEPWYPPLRVFGWSARGGAAGGVLWIEYGYYDSRDGERLGVRNSSQRYLVGFERQVASDLSASVQVFLESLTEPADIGLCLDGSSCLVPTEPNPEDLVTFRVEKLLHYQTIRLSFFGFWSLDEPGVHLRPSVSYDMSDAVRITAGASLFDGDAHTTFGSFDESDSVFGRLRYSF